MTKFRVKTEAEFEEDGLWNVISQKDGVSAMVKHLGKDIPAKFNAKCEKKATIFVFDWLFTKDMYISHEEAKERLKGTSFKVSNTKEVII